MSLDRPPDGYTIDAALEVGATVGILARHSGFWFLNACRAVSVTDVASTSRKSGFCSRTLPLHAERGAETYSVEWREEDDTVWYDIVAFSRPSPWNSRLAYPVARALQEKFPRQSMAAMLRETS